MKDPSDDPGDYWLGIAIIVVMMIAIGLTVIYEPLAAHLGWPT